MCHVYTHNYLLVNYSPRLEIYSALWLLMFHNYSRQHTYTMFCPGYLEWWLDSTLHLVLFIQFIFNSVQ